MYANSLYNIVKTKKYLIRTYIILISQKPVRRSESFNSLSACFPWTIVLSLGAQYFKAENIIYALLSLIFNDVAM
jgi:hypothetical protein